MNSSNVVEPHDPDMDQKLLLTANQKEFEEHRSKRNYTSPQHNTDVHHDWNSIKGMATQEISSTNPPIIKSRNLSSSQSPKARMMTAKSSKTNFILRNKQYLHGPPREMSPI